MFFLLHLNVSDFRLPKGDSFMSPNWWHGRLDPIDEKERNGRRWLKQRRQSLQSFRLASSDACWLTCPAVLWIWSLPTSKRKDIGYICTYLYIYIYIHIYIFTHNLVIGAVESCWISLQSAAHEWESQALGCASLFCTYHQNGQDRESHQAPYQKKYEAASKAYEEVPLALCSGSRCVWSFHDR